MIDGFMNSVDAFTPEARTQGTNGTILSYVGSNRGALLITKYCNCVGVDPDHFGRPLCERVSSISAVASTNHPTFFKCGEGENNIKCYDMEKSLISDFLVKGFFYE